MIETILSVAAAEIGVKESPKGSNKVKYNTWYYGKSVSGAAYPWCMVFVTWVFHQADLSGLFCAGNKVASCTVLMNWAKLNGQWVTKDYKPGDVVIFDWNLDGRTDHTGIIEAVPADGKTLTTLEGNTSMDNNSNGGAVMRRQRSIKYVAGAFRPAYGEEDDMLIEELAKIANLSVEETKKRLAEAIKDNPWEQAGIDYLMSEKLINQVRPPGAPVSWGEFGIVQQRIAEALRK